MLPRVKQGKRRKDRHPKPVADFYSPEEIKRVYYVEVERDAPGANRVIVF